MAGTTIETKALGKLSWTKFNKLVKEADGDRAEAARRVGVSPTTFRRWGTQLEAARKG